MGFVASISTWYCTAVHGMESSRWNGTSAWNGIVYYIAVMTHNAFYPFCPFRVYVCPKAPILTAAIVWASSFSNTQKRKVEKEFPTLLSTRVEDRGASPLPSLRVSSRGGETNPQAPRCSFLRPPAFRDSQRRNLYTFTTLQQVAGRMQWFR